MAKISADSHPAEVAVWLGKCEIFCWFCFLHAHPFFLFPRLGRWGVHGPGLGMWERRRRDGRKPLNHTRHQSLTNHRKSPTSHSTPLSPSLSPARRVISCMYGMKECRVLLFFSLNSAPFVPPFPQTLRCTSENSLHPHHRLTGCPPNLRKRSLSSTGLDLTHLDHGLSLSSSCSRDSEEDELDPETDQNYYSGTDFFRVRAYLEESSPSTTKGGNGIKICPLAVNPHFLFVFACLFYFIF